MPIYEYRCENCGHELEAIQKISDALLTQCPACTADALIKKISAAGFRLKGGGWYETDFKSGNKKNVSGAQNSDSDAATSADSSASSSASSSDGAGSSKSETKDGDSKTTDSSGSSSAD